MESKEQCKNICNIFDQLIEINDIFLYNKTKLYCEYVLGLGKEYVDGISNDLYEKCENYLKNLSSEEVEKQFIKSYESDLALKGKEICVEVDLFTNNEFLIKKAFFYCENIHRLKDVDQKLVNKCKDYKDKVNNFYSYLNSFEKNNFDRELKQELFDM